MRKLRNRIQKNIDLLSFLAAIDLLISVKIRMFVSCWECFKLHCVYSKSMYLLSASQIEHFI